MVPRTLELLQNGTGRRLQLPLTLFFAPCRLINWLTGANNITFFDKDTIRENIRNSDWYVTVGMYESLRNQVFIRRVQLFHQPNAAPRILFQPAKDDLLSTAWHYDGLDCPDLDSWLFCATRQDELLISKPQCVELTIKGKAVLPYQVHSEDEFIFNIGHQDPRFQAKTPQLQIHLHFADHCSGLTCN